MAFATKDNLHVGDTLYAVVGPSWSGDIDVSEVTVTKVNGTSFYYTFNDRASDYAWKASMAKGYNVDMGGHLFSSTGVRSVRRVSLTHTSVGRNYGKE